MGTLVGERFEILKELGRGSRGVVYLASDREKNRQVALKIFSKEIDQFQNEFSLLSELHNPSLAEIYQFNAKEHPNRHAKIRRRRRQETLIAHGPWRDSETTNGTSRCSSLIVNHRSSALTRWTRRRSLPRSSPRG